MAQMLRLHRVLDPHPAQDLGREARQPGDPDLGALGQRVAEAQDAVIGDADDVAGPGLLGQVALARQEEHRVLHGYSAAGAQILQLHAALEMPRAQPHKGDAVAVLRVDIGLHLEHEPGNRRFSGQYRPRPGSVYRRLRPRRRRQQGHPTQQFAHPEIVQRAAEENRRQVALAERLQVKRRAQAARHLDLLAQRDDGLRGQPRRQRRVVEPGAADRFDQSLARGRARTGAAVAEHIIGAEEIAPVPIGQLAGVASSARVCSISSIRSNGSRLSRSSLLMKVMIGTSRSRHTSNSLRVCSSMPRAASITMIALSTAVSVR